MPTSPSPFTQTTGNICFPLANTIYQFTCLPFGLASVFLGFTIDSINLELRLPPEKLKKIRVEAWKLVGAELISARSLARLLGKMTATSNVIPPAPLFYRHLQMDLAKALRADVQNYETELRLSSASKEELIWWDTHLVRWNGKSVMTRDPELTIDSDAPKLGWGATSQEVSMGGPWSTQESARHINCLELMAATLALKTFAKNKTELSVLLRIDNTTAVVYINHQGGTVSEELVLLTCDLWMWCLERNIHIHAEHLPGCMNTVADRESQSMQDHLDWKLDRKVFTRINKIFGPMEVDLFASRLTHQCQHYFNWQPDPFAEATDAFQQDWSGTKGFANPPWNLIANVLSKTQTQRARIVLVAPVWKSQPWYPLILSMLVDIPRLLPHHVSMIAQLEPQLAVWSIS